MKEYVGIQYLRGLAAVLVVVYHLGQPLERLGHAVHWPGGLSAGVDIFFVISGFVMWITTRTRDTTPIDFWRKRLVRIVPLYWLVTTFMLTVLLVAPQVMQTSRFDAKHVIASYLFIPALNPGKPVMEPLLFPGWTLNYEMFFYAIFGLFLLAGPKLRLWGTIGVLTVLVALGAAFDVPHLSVAGFYSDSIMLEFALGMMLGELVHQRSGQRILPRTTGWFLFALGLACLIAVPQIEGVPRAIRYGLPALFIVLGCLSIECDGGVREIPLFHHIGNASYSIYLTQLVTMAAFLVLWRKLGLEPSVALAALFCVLDVLIAVAGGIVSYHLLEKPFIGLFRTKRAPAAATA